MPRTVVQAMLSLGPQGPEDPQCSSAQMLMGPQLESAETSGLPEEGGRELSTLKSSSWHATGASIVS